MPSAAKATNSSVPQQRLFELLELAAARGASFARVSEVDRFVNAGSPAWFLKHDVHGLPLDRLIGFAGRQQRLNIVGTYLFMAPDHPLTRPFYSWREQAAAMRAVRELGHEIGLHVDPYFLIDQQCKPLNQIIQAILDAFAAEGLDAVTVGNMHGNSKFKHPDVNGYGTMFDLFDELGRQPDFPALASVPQQTAELIREHRVSLADLGFTHWADMPLWSARHGFVVTNFVTDNQLGKKGTLEVLVQSDTIGQYKLIDRQPPGSRTPAPARKIVQLRAAAGGLEPLSRHVRLVDDESGPMLESLAGHPTLILLHPEHYC